MLNNRDNFHSNICTKTIIAPIEWNETSLKKRACKCGAKTSIAKKKKKIGEKRRRKREKMLK